MIIVIIIIMMIIIIMIIIIIIITITITNRKKVDQVASKESLYRSWDDVTLLWTRVVISTIYHKLTNLTALHPFLVLTRPAPP